MTTLSKTLCAVLLSCGFAGSAVAATDSAQTGSNNSQSATSNTQTPAHIRQKLHDDLTKAGYTDITIMPSSFLVRAKDSEGKAMMMVINPDSVTEVTAESAPSANGQANSSNPSSTAQSNDSNNSNSSKSSTKQ